MLLIYTHHITPRINYTFDLVFSNVLTIEYKLTDNIDYYNEFTGSKFAYTNTENHFETIIYSHSLLFETSYRPLNITHTKTTNNLPVFFETNQQSFLDYDIFATVFYFASNYQEYNANSVDKHQRFQAEESLLYKSISCYKLSPNLV